MGAGREAKADSDTPISRSREPPGAHVAPHEVDTASAYALSSIASDGMLKVNTPALTASLSPGASHDAGSVAERYYRVFHHRCKSSFIGG